MSGLTIKKKVVILIVCIMVILTAISLVVFSMLRVDDANIINAMGRQRMLSQAMAKSILGYNMSKNSIKNMEQEIRHLDGYISKVRSTYVKNIVSTAKEAGIDISMPPNTDNHPAVPFPATFTRLVNESFGNTGKLSIDIISEYPINSNHSLKDGIDKEAHHYLSKNKKDFFMKSHEKNAFLYLRFYTADIATIKACADCHSTMEGKNYKVGDMLGIRKFNVTFSSDIALGKAKLNPSIEEFESARQIFTETLAAFKSGGKYPGNLKLTKHIEIAAIDIEAAQEKIRAIEKDLAKFNHSVERMSSSKIGSIEN